jgi:hypothetical protein
MGQPLTWCLLQHWWLADKTSFKSYVRSFQRKSFHLTCVASAAINTWALWATIFGQMTTKYKPRTQKIKSWDDLDKYYVDLNNHNWGHDRLLGLVRHIKNSGLGSRLTGSITMLDKLIVSIYDPIEWDREALHIEFDRHNNNWIFKYYSRPNEKPEFERKYNADLGIEKFDNFVSMIKW